MTIIDVQNLAKQFGHDTVLRNVNIKFEAGTEINFQDKKREVW